MASRLGLVGDILNSKRNEDDDYFKILGCSDTSTDEQIIAEYKARALQCHPDKHPNDPQALAEFQKLQEAKETLLNPEKRSKYDRWRASEMCLSYKQWLSMANRCTTTMHWAKPKEQTMLQSGSNTAPCASDTSHYPVHQQQTSQPFVWRPEDSTSIYSKFRNYKI